MNEIINCLDREWWVHQRWGWMHDKQTPRANCWNDPSAITINSEGIVSLNIHRNLAVVDTNQKLVTNQWVENGQFIPELYEKLKTEPNSLFTAEYGTGLLCSVENFGFGHYTLEAILPSGDYLWPAFWLHTDKPNSSEEIDVFEAYSLTTNYQIIKKCLFSKRFAGWNIKSCLHSNNKKLKGTGVSSPDIEDFNQNPSTRIVKYEFHWGSTYMAFYINDIVYRYILDTRILDHFAKFDGSMFVVINNYIDGRYWKKFKIDPVTHTPMRIISFEYKPL